ncbi:RNA polymerase II associated protein 2 [Rhizoclosmatium sp. JEL0117]|nr:RNA polymerase II associated protein 2 [Rhizoclosmatium sp. JEL0117]
MSARITPMTTTQQQPQNTQPKRRPKAKAKAALPPKPKPVTARQTAVKTSAVTKKQWDDQVFDAMQEHLFEGKVTKDMLRNLTAKFLEPRHYEAVLEERIAIDICGYPLCEKPRMKAVGQYRISNNKVYDITNLKRFCSKECMAASSYLQTQIPVDPGYIRDYDSVRELLEILDASDMASIRTSIDATKGSAPLDKASRDALVMAHIKELVSQAPKPPSIPSLVGNISESILDPDALVIRENTNPDISGLLNFNTLSISAEDAEMVEGFRVSRQGRALTDLLAEYEEKRQERERQSKQVSQQPQPIPSAQPPKATEQKPTALSTDSTLTDNEFTDAEDVSDEEPTTTQQWPRPSKKSVSQSASRTHLSLFGRLHTYLSTLPTSETKNYIEKSPTNMDAFHASLFDHGHDMDALSLRTKIFSERAAKACMSICRRARVEMRVEWVLELLETFWVRSGEFVGGVEERVVALCFIKVVADVRGGVFLEEVCGRVWVERVVRGETGGNVGVDEVGALVRSVFYM